MFSRRVETNGDEMGFGPLPEPLARAMRDSMIAVGLASQSWRVEGEIEDGRSDEERMEEVQLYVEIASKRCL